MNLENWTMVNIGTKVVLLVCVLLGTLAVASVMTSPEFQHTHFVRPTWWF